MYLERSSWAFIDNLTIVSSGLFILWYTKIMIIKSHFGAVLLIFLLAGCAGLDMKDDSPQPGVEAAAETIPLLREYAPPVDLEFQGGGFSLPAAAPGVGAITRNQEDPLTSLAEDAKRAVAESFRRAYVEGLLRGLTLEGTLGGDLVHSWPPAAALSPAQNWRSRETAPNSWGMPSLVLAIRGAVDGAVHIVRGGILDRYGQSGGRDRANGVAGYGAPLGEEFLYRDGIAQWFEHGLIRVDAAGRAFFEAGPPPAPPPDSAGRYAGEDETIGAHFQQALRRAAYSNLPDLDADGPVWRLGIPETRVMPAGTLYYQTFNRGSVLLLLSHFPNIPLQTRTVSGPFLDAFLGNSAEADLEGRLLWALASYGFPLTDAYPALNHGSYREAQRFTRGWMLRR
jgi:hypothetical protein